MKKDIVLVGGGGHCVSCIDTIVETGLYRILGILDFPDKVGDRILNYSVIGTDKDISDHVKKGVSFLITIGRIEAGKTVRNLIYETLNSLGANSPAIISPYAHVSNYAKVGLGTVVLSGVVINAGAIVGENCIINSGAIVEHDSIIGSNTHVSTGAIVNGGCLIGNNCFVASGVIIRNGVTIADNVMIGMGSVVTKDIIDPGMYYGVPARKIRL